MENGKTAEELQPGDRASLSRTVSETDLALFASATGDVNPIHFDQSYAESTFFRGRIAHGILAAGLISGVIGTRLPGLSTIYVSQSLKFLAPVRIGDTLTAGVEVLEVDPGRNRVRLRTTCVNQEGTTVLDGEAVVMPPKRRPEAELAEAIAQRAEQTDRRLGAATLAFTEALAGSAAEGIGSPTAAWTGALLGCQGDVARAVRFWVEQGARLQQEGQEAARQWLDLLSRSGREYLRAWEEAGRGTPS